MARVAASVPGTPLAVVAAWLVVSTWYTVQGCLPTSVTVQPHSMASTVAAPDRAPPTRNTVPSRPRGRSRRCHQYSASHTPHSSISVPTPTIRSKDRWSSVGIGGRSPGGTVSQPVTRVCGENPTSSESTYGTLMPVPVTTWPWYQTPPIHSGTSRAVAGTYSIDANLTGWLLAMARAAVSPTPIWNGVAIAATTNGSRKP